MFFNPFLKKLFSENEYTIKERIAKFDDLLKFIIRKKLLSNILILFLKSNELLPIFDKKICFQTPCINKIQSVEENFNQILHKSNHSVDLHQQSSSDKTNIISLGEKLHYNFTDKESGNLKDSSVGNYNARDLSDDNSNCAISNPRFT